MTTDTNHNDNNTAAILLFCGTILASQLLQNKRDKQEKVQIWRQQYKLNRLHNRLSYTDLTAQMKSSSSPELIHNNKNNNNNNDTMNSVQAGADEDAFDYIPKNGNWRHFESSNEDDFKDGTVTPPPHDDDDDDEDASSSSSSSEAFLWTKAGTNKEKRRPVDRVVSKPTTTTAPTHTTASTTWMGRLRKTVAGLTHDDEFSTTKPIDQQQQHPSQSIPQNYASMRRSASTPEVAAMNAAANAAPATSNNNNRTAARAQYNARIMPNKVVMVRHGQSEGNLNELLYSTTPDNAMRLTKLGWNQALETGKVLKNQVLATGEPIHFIVSPYVRTVETFHGLVSAWCDPKEFNHIPNREKRLTAWYSRLLELGLTWHEDPRIREQDFGNYQVPLQIQKAKQERHRFGPFFYRFPHGESASDVFDRVSTFLDSLWRSFDMNRSRNYVLVTHGISIRVLLARYFRYSIDQFSLLANPKNCEMVILGHDGAGKLQLDGRCELKVEENEETGEPQVRGHEFHKRLRVLPKRFVHKLNVRVSYDDQIGPPLVVGFDTNVVDIQEALIDAGGEPSKVPPRSDLATELHRAQSLGR